MRCFVTIQTMMAQSSFDRSSGGRMQYHQELLGDVSGDGIDYVSESETLSNFYEMSSGNKKRCVCIFAV